MLRISIFLILLQIVSLAEDWKLETLYDGEVHSRNEKDRTMLYRSSDLSTHIFYGEDHLYHLKYTNGAWSKEVVDSSNNVGKNISVAVASDGSLHVSYTNEIGVLKYASKALNADEWVISQIDDTTIRNTAICTDSDGVAHIFYTRNDGIYVVHSNDINQTELFVFNASKAAVVYDAQSGIHVTYVSRQSNHEGVWYANNHTGEFVHRHIYNTTANIQKTSIDANTLSGKKAIAIKYYSDGGFGKFFDTAIGNYDAAWSTSIAFEGVVDVSVKVSATAVSTALSVDDNQIPNYALKMVRKDQMGTQASELMRGYAYYEHIDLEYINNSLRIQYYDSLSNSIGWVYKNANLEWDKEKIRDFNVVGNFWGVDMELYNKRPKITFKTPHDGLQYFDKSVDGSWKSTPLASTVIYDPKLSTIEDGFTDSWVQYINTQTHALERVKRDHYFNGLFSGWKWFTLEASNSIQDADIQTRRQNHDVATQGLATHSCYIDSASSLFYVNNDNRNGWSQSIPLHNNKLVFSCAIALDAQEHVHIVYTTNIDEIYYITNESGSWLYEELIPDNDRKINPRILVSDGIVHISFFNATQRKIEYLKSSNFSIQTPRSWPLVARVVMDNDSYSYLNLTKAFDMVIDKKEKIHFAVALRKALYHIKEKGLGFDIQETDLGFFVDGLKLAVSDDALHVVFLNEDKGDVIYASLKTIDIVMPPIMYLLF